MGTKKYRFTVQKRMHSSLSLYYESKLHDENSDEITHEELAQKVIEKYLPIAKGVLNPEDKRVRAFTLEFMCEELSDLLK